MSRFDRFFAPVIDLFFPPRAAELVVRNLRTDDLLEILAPATHMLETGSAVTLLPYDDPYVRTCVLEAKFHGNKPAARLLASVAATYIKEELIERDAFGRLKTALLPVPLSRARLRERGYNQAEVIARHITVELEGVDIDTSLLTRVRDTRPQTELGGAERRRNVRGSFAATRIPDPRIRYLVLDDVMTTGATMEEATRALSAAGAQRVISLALAH